MSARSVAAVSAIALLAIACGSTSKDAVTATSTDDAGVTVSDAPAASGGPVATDAAGNPVGNATVSAPGGSSVGSAGGTTASGARPVAKGTGTIKIGFHYSTNLDAAYAAFGAEGEFVDVEAAINKMVAYVNAHGGLGGKRIVHVFHATDPLNGTFPAQAERACTFFADDAKVDYVVSGAILPDDNMPACFAKRHLPLVWDYQYLTARDTFDKYANTLYMPSNIGTYRFGFYIDALKAAGYFEKGAKIGLVRYDTAVHKEFADKIVKAGLARIGLKLTAEAAITKPQSAGEAGDSAAQASSAILRFSNAGITHLIFSPSGGAIPLIWGASADGQNFHPRNAFNSLDIPAFVTDNMSEEQLDRAVVVGWMPAGDTYAQYVPKTPAWEQCRTATGIRDDTDMARFCDGLFFLKAALDASPTFGVPGLRSAVESLGTGFASPWTPSTRFGPGRHDGAQSYRLMQFDAACTCFKFTSGPKSIP
jgi:hypothetical protein